MKRRHSEEYFITMALHSALYPLDSHLHDGIPARDAQLLVDLVLDG